MGQGQSLKVDGYVAPGFESVKEMFTENFKRGKENSAQLCVYLEEEKVVDLWGSVTSDTFTGDCITNVFSSTKTLAAMAVATLADRGLLSYSDRIEKHWPEFGQNGKEETTVADLLRHEAGLANLDTTLSSEDFSREGIKENRVGSVIERQTPEFPPSGKRQYHAVTRGWILNELFRRVEPTGATIGEFLEERVSQPLQAAVHIGGSPTAPYHPVENIGLGYVVGQSLLPEAVGSAVDQNFLELVAFLNRMRNMFNEAKKAGKPKAIAGMDSTNQVWNTQGIRSGEIPSANGNCSARGLAIVAAVMANGGSFKGYSFLSPAGWEAFHKDPVEGMIYSLNVKFTQGGVAQLEEADGGGRDGYTGWMGLGGSVMQWHPRLKIGFAYVPTLLTWVDLNNNKARLLQEEVSRCAATVRSKATT